MAMNSLYTVIPHADGGKGEQVLVMDLAQFSVYKDERYFYQMYYQLHTHLLQQFGGMSCHPAEFVSARRRSCRAKRVLAQLQKHGDKHNVLGMVEDALYRIQALANLTPPDEDVGHWPRKTFRSRRFKSWFKNEMLHWLRTLPPFLLQQADALKAADGHRGLRAQYLASLGSDGGKEAEKDDDTSSVVSFASAGGPRSF